MTDRGVMSYFLGMEINQTDHGIFISQNKYAEEILRKFKMENCKPTEVPLGVNEKLSKEYGGGKANEGTYRRLIGNLLYLTSTRPDLMFTMSLLSRFMHSPSDIHFKTAKRVLSIFSWNSRKQEVVSQSIAEAEYIVTAAAANQAIWLRKFLCDLFQIRL
ncbi:uncharacterized protein LOC111374794 [Olea europaea var. sylvestris]|uniref:uncharacterized protein LOC111374794 n=1 Tax=Olea europaea var. sylvestris TaxID=158386 RepID=UPI000C1D50F6|nr:uncharacterized protein LOC111374794 [Olea europaea var. sylvestris]